MLSLVLNALASVLVAAIAVHACILHVRLGRLRAALSEMGSVLPEFDASVNRIAAMADGFTVKVSTELESIEARLQAARRLSVELASASREAEEAAAELGRALRQTKRSEPMRAAALPREMVEPKGFAERAGLPPVQFPSGNGDSLPQAADIAPAQAQELAEPQASGNAQAEAAGDEREPNQPSPARSKPRRVPKADKEARSNNELEQADGLRRYSRRAEPAKALAVAPVDNGPTRRPARRSAQGAAA